MAIPGVGGMTDSETADFIRQSPCGTLTFVDGDRPYSVVLEHYYDGKNFFFITSNREDQRKYDCMKHNTRASFMIYESRREKPEIVKQGIMCRSVLVEGTAAVAAVRQVNQAVSVRVLKLVPEAISNWRCPRTSCDWKTRWYERAPELLEGLSHIPVH